MISPWEIYLVMQLDSIGFLLIVVPILSVFFICIAGVVTDGDAIVDSSGDKGRILPWVKVSAVAAALSFITSFMLPSSKTAAAMLVIPAIANDEAVQNEAGELYGLAKDALKRVAEPEKPVADEATTVAKRATLNPVNQNTGD